MTTEFNKTETIAGGNMGFQLKEKTAPIKPCKLTFGLGVAVEKWENPETGEVRTYWKYVLPDSVQVMGITSTGEIIAIREFQPGLGIEYLHLIGETMEEGETPAEAAKRGLFEETGYVAGRLVQLSTILENTGRSDRLLHFFLVTDCVKIRKGEKEVKVELMKPPFFWQRMMDYFLHKPEEKHGGANTLKLTTLAYEYMEWIEVKRGN